MHLRTHSLAALALLALVAACGDSATGPSVAVPAIVDLPSTPPGEYDTDSYYLLCQMDGDPRRVTSPTCPVVRLGDVDYWAFSFGDNRNSFAIHAYAKDGTLLGVHELPGARYLYSVSIDQAAETVTFVGQTDFTATITFDELRAIT